MVVVSMLPHAEVGRNDHREGAPHFGPKPFNHTHLTDIKTGEFLKFQNFLASNKINNDNRKKIKEKLEQEKRDIHSVPFRN